MIIPGPGGGGAATPLPMTNLYAQYDANDIARHTPASGLWSPSAGFDTTSLQAIDSSGSNMTFSYGANQNGLRVIDLGGTAQLVPASTSASATTDATILMAFRLNSGSRALSIGQQGGDFFRWQVASSNQWQASDADGDETRFNKTNIAATNGAYRIVGLTWDNTLNRVLVLSNGLFYASGGPQPAAATMADLLLRSTNTGYGGWGSASPSNGAGVEIGEVLIYSTADIGQAIMAVRYLEDRWRVTT